ncbi:MAG: hypothetical protein JSR60_04265 [Proteobacteria bacterium]|nr:hypothetical protein [Pseudomonadota bacterium]
MTRSFGRLVPREKGAAPLDLVIAVMAFLAALALGASMLAARASEGWRAGLADHVTVQILVPEQGDVNTVMANEVEAALVVLRATPGIGHAAPLSDKEMQALVEPWLGKGALVADLPLPRLIDGSIVPGAAVDMSSLAARLKQAAPDAELDDHSHWIARLSTLADSIQWSALGVLVLIAIATASTVAFATRAGLEAQHEMVALLHQMGAHALFIARAFERHYALATLGASLAGASIAATLFALAGGLEFAGIEPVPFLPPIALKLSELAWLVAVPIVATAIAWITARLSVLAAVREIY